MKKQFLLLFVLFCFTASITVAQSEEKLWKKIVKTGNERKTERLVKKYFIKYPDGKYKDDIEIMTLGKCLSKNDKGQCGVCVKYFPKGDRVELAWRVLNGHPAFDVSSSPGAGSGPGE